MNSRITKPRIIWSSERPLSSCTQQLALSVGVFYQSASTVPCDIHLVSPQARSTIQCQLHAPWYRSARVYHNLSSLIWPPCAAAGNHHSRPNPPSPRCTPFPTTRTSTNGNAGILVLQICLCWYNSVTRLPDRYTKKCYASAASRYMCYFLTILFLRCYL